MMHWGSDFGMGFGWIFMVLFWGLIIIGVVSIIKSLAGKSSAGENSRESAEEILTKRFARGEITAEEFEESIKVLKQNRQ
jgi:putative membrane protein